VDGQAEAVRAFSETTGRAFSLYPTRSAPTMLISGIPMHRIKDTDPYQDTLAKLRALGPAGGRVLDTATGLGYTAIQAARTAEQVVTIELDPAAREMCRLNPWSQELFTRANIELHLGDSFDQLEQMQAGTFSSILHDPPAFALAGDLYSADFYRLAWRALKPRGRMFHYIGDPQSKSGAQVTRGVVRRLLEAGFTRVEPRPLAFGVLALKH
jgi:predicted methyltransferase